MDKFNSWSPSMPTHDSDGIPLVLIVHDSSPGDGWSDPGNSTIVRFILSDRHSIDWKGCWTYYAVQRTASLSRTLLPDPW